MSERPPLHLFEGYGVELEYMIVDRETFDVKAVCDRVLEAETGQIVNEICREDIDWSNELALHVIELKTSGPVHDLSAQAPLFQRDVRKINDILSPMGARLMPTAMHPWMDPHREMQLWPHEYNPIYEAFNRIFDCTGHGWANLQSVHLNLPFAGDDEFARLHAAIRVLMPLMPALAASSPMMDGQVTGLSDNRLANYKAHCHNVPSLTGRIIPEAIGSIQQYHDEVLRRIYDDLEPHDPEGILRFEWANARGAIARFSRNAIEIRVLDVQECPAMDVAIVGAIAGVLKVIIAETWGDVRAQNAWSTELLAEMFARVIREGEQATIDHEDYLRGLGLADGKPRTAGQVWRHLIEAAREHDGASLSFCEDELDVLIERGPLSRRMRDRLGESPSRDAIKALYTQLADCLQEGKWLE